ncbi:hypothetical protein M9434_006720 [Picochlorum sp. BPE23]|nr:hypothetical protein M9434_006720 [Picochlorum sp. BPE23]
MADTTSGGIRRSILPKQKKTLGREDTRTECRDAAKEVDVTGLGEYVVYDYTKRFFRPLNSVRGAVEAEEEDEVEQHAWTDPDSTRKKSNATHRLRLSAKVWTQKSLCYDCWTSCDRVTTVDRCVGEGVDGVQGLGGGCMKELGRVLFLNSDPDAFRDFLMWNDPVDDCQPMHGTLLPLWDVSCRAMDGDEASSAYDQGMQITAMCFDPNNHDVLAVGLGSLEYEHSSIGGRVSVYGLLDLHRPHFTIELQSGVTSIAFGPDGWLAVGCQDGGVVVMCPRRGSTSSHTGLIDRESYTVLPCRLDQHHVFPVWHVSMFLSQEEEDHAVVMIRSVSQDGVEGIWSCQMNDDDDECVHRLQSSIIGVENSTSEYDPGIFVKASNTDVFQAISCADRRDGVAVYGTLNGHTMSMTSTSPTHHMAPVQSVSINPFDAAYCLSASLDWTVSIRNSQTLESKLDIDIGQPVTDAQWSPHASTILGVITRSGDALVYDVSVSKEVPLCHQRISGTDSLTKILFHRRDPLLLIGTTGGRIVCMKLSPNLLCRKQADDSADFAFLDDDGEDSVKPAHRPILPMEEQIDILHDTLKHPY